MSVGSGVPYNAYTGNGLTTVFSYGFTLLDADDLVVTVDGVVTSSYTVSGIGVPAGGSVTFSAAPANGTAVLLQRVIQLVRTTEYQTNGDLQAETVNGDFDRLWMALQNTDAAGTRSLRAPEIGVLPELPAAADRASLLLGFDSSGNPIAVAPTGGSAAALALDLAASDSVAHGTGQIGHLAAGTSATGRTAKARLDAVPMAGDFATLALAAASGRSSLTLEAGTYAVSANLNITVPVHAMPGALIVPAAGVTVTFAGGFDAGIYRCFDISAAGSAIAFSPATTRSGYAEWWGATPNVDSNAARTANVTAINAAVVALTRTELLPADYYTDAKILHAVRGHELAGANCHSFGGTQGFVTNIYCNSATATMLQIGPDTYPGSINAMPQGIAARNIQLRRTVQPTIASAPAGLKMQFVLKATVESVFSTESIYSFEIHNTVACRVDRCESRRSLVGGGAGTDLWYGYYVNGDNSTVGWGLPGGNASLYLSYSSASCNEVGLQASGSSGFYLDQQFTDVFISWCEAGDCTTPINVQGNSAAGTSFGNTDLHISHFIADTARLFGLFIKNLAASGTVDIDGFYCAPSSLAVSAATAAIYVQDSEGSVNVTGGQLVLGASTLARGVVVDNSSGVSVIGTQITEATANPVLLATAANCNIRPVINNAGITGPAAVSMSGTCTGNVVAPIVKGKAGAFSSGISVAGTGDSRNTYDVGGIDSACISGGYANKCVRNGSTALSSATMVPTYSGTNLVTGCAG